VLIDSILDELELSERLFYLLPLIHSEDLQDHIYVNQLGEVFLKENPNYENIKKSWGDHMVVIKSLEGILIEIKF
jgi:uncharacterized protein (DUF924 family)